MKYLYFVILLNILVHTVYGQDTLNTEPVVSDTMVSDNNNNSEIIPQSEISFNLFGVFFSGLDLTYHHPLYKNLYFRTNLEYFWSLYETDKYYSIHPGIKFTVYQNQKNRIYVLSEVGYYSTELKIDKNNSKNFSGHDIQLGIGYIWMPHENIFSMFEIGWTFINKEKVDTTEGQKESGPFDRRSFKIGIMF